MRLKIGGERNYFSAFSITYRIKNCNGASKVIFSKNNFLNRKDKPPARLVGRSCRNPCRGPLGKAAHCGRAVLFFPKNFAAMLARTTERRHFSITSSTHKRRYPMGIAFCVVGRGRFELPKS